MGKFKYRGYLDGLRGISVLLVVLFHTSSQLFREGFLGVDVFFVLSGYLITSIVLMEVLNTEGLSITRFYARRARRILPAASITLIIMSVLSRILINKYFVSELRMCYLAAATYWANFCFVMEDNDYWKQDQETSPMKHYWSLSVEEQFYVIYPFVVWAITKFIPLLPCFRKKKNASEGVIAVETEKGGKKYKTERFIILVFLIAAVIVSFGVSLYLMINSSISESHMSSFGRIYQLGIGAILAIVLDHHNQKDNPVKKRFIRIIAVVVMYVTVLAILFMMTYAIYIRNVSIHPTISGYVMTVLVTLLIYSFELEAIHRGVKKEDPFPRKFLRWAPLIWLGKLSYSIYLWHHPLIVIGDNYNIFRIPFEVNEIVVEIYRIMAIVLASIILGILSYFGIEKPYMKINFKSDKVKRFLLASCGIIIPIVSACIVFLIMNVNADNEFIDGDSVSVDDAMDDSNSSFYEDVNIYDYLEDDTIDIWSPKRVFLYGDSHALKMENMFELLSELVGFEFHIVHCGAMPSTYYSDERILAHKFNCDFLTSLPTTVKNFNPDLIIIANTVIQYPCPVIGGDCTGYSKIEQKYVDEYEEKLYGLYDKLLVNSFEGVNVLHILPTPINTEMTKTKFIACLAENDKKLSNCNFKVGRRFTYQTVVDTLAKYKSNHKGAYRTLNADELVCPGGECKAKFKDVLRFQDTGHVSSDFWLLNAEQFFMLLLTEGILLTKEN